MTKCTNAYRYKGKRRPTCNQGVPCDACLKKWNAELARQQQVALDTPSARPDTGGFGS